MMLMTKIANMILITEQPPGGVLRKKCSENKQQIYWRTPLPNKATLSKSHFGMSVLLQICFIFSEYLFLKTPFGGCFCD